MNVPKAASKLEPNISDLLARQRRKVVPILGDGNCFFRAIAHIIHKSQENHNSVRTEIVNYIHMNSAQLGQLLIGNDTIEQHIAKMRVPGEWATQVELQAATEVYGRALYLYTLTPAKDAYQWHCYMPKTRSPIQGHIELAHPSGVHFEVLWMQLQTQLAKPLHS